MWHDLATFFWGDVWEYLTYQGCPSFQIGPQYVVSGGEARLDDVSKIVGGRKCSWRFDESNNNQYHSWKQDDLGSNMNENCRWDIWYYLMTLAFLVGMRFLWWMRKLYRLDIKWTWMDINWLSSARRAVASKLQEPVKALKRILIYFECSSLITCHFHVWLQTCEFEETRIAGTHEWFPFWSILGVPSTCKIWVKPEPLCWTLPADSCDYMGRCRTTKSMWHVRPAMSPWTTFDWSSLNARPGDQGTGVLTTLIRVFFDWFELNCCSVLLIYWEQLSFWLFFVWWVGGDESKRMQIRSHQIEDAVWNDSLPVWKNISSMIATKQTSQMRKVAHSNLTSHLSFNPINFKSSVVRMVNGHLWPCPVAGAAQILRRLPGSSLALMMGMFTAGGMIWILLCTSFKCGMWDGIVIFMSEKDVSQGTMWLVLILVLTLHTDIPLCQESEPTTPATRQQPKVLGICMDPPDKLPVNVASQMHFSDQGQDNFPND